MNLLDNDTINEFFGCDELCTMSHHGYCQAIKAQRILKAMQQPIKKGDFILLVDEHGEDGALRVEQFEADQDVTSVLHSSLLRLPEDYQRHPCKADDIYCTCGVKVKHPKEEPKQFIADCIVCNTCFKPMTAKEHWNHARYCATGKPFATPMTREEIEKSDIVLGPKPCDHDGCSLTTGTHMHKNGTEVIHINKKCTHNDVWFDRSIDECSTMCQGAKMHDYCSDCGASSCQMWREIQPVERCSKCDNALAYCDCAHYLD